jgi:hypothetical protein
MKRIVLALLALAACSKPEAPPPTSATLEKIADSPAVVPLPDPDLQGGHVGRAPRRITVAQLDQNIQVTTGRRWSQIDTLAPSLGRADYALVNQENIEPNLVFAKFLEDGAREVCLATATADKAIPLAKDRVLSREVPETIIDLTKIDDATAKKNLVYLTTRFWGQPLAGSELDGWAATFKATATRAQFLKKPEQLYGAICIALMTDSRFISY